MIDKQKVLANPILKLIFEEEEFKELLDSFIKYADTGSKMDVKIIIHDLLEMAIENCGISMSERTVYHDFAWEVLNSFPEFWTEEEKEAETSQISKHWQEYNLSMSIDEFSKYDITIMEDGDYLITAMNIINDHTNKNILPQFAYASYLFFKELVKFYSIVHFDIEKELQNIKEIITEWREEDC